jgi:hypothetical protein
MLNYTIAPSVTLEIYKYIGPTINSIKSGEIKRDEWWNMRSFYYKPQQTKNCIRNIFNQSGVFFFIKHIPNNYITHIKINGYYKVLLSKPQQLYGYDVYQIVPNIRDIKNNFINSNRIDNCEYIFKSPINNIDMLYCSFLDKSVTMCGMHGYRFS